MQRAMLVVLTNPVSGNREAEYNKWYEREHLPEMCALPQVVSATRYRVADIDSPLLAPEVEGRRYLACYEIEADDISSVMADLETARQAGNITFSGCLQTDPAPLSFLVTQVDGARSSER